MFLSSQNISRSFNIECTIQSLLTHHISLAYFSKFIFYMYKSFWFFSRHRSVSGQLSIATVPSPASVGQSQGDDDKEYMEKLKQLQKYIEPLSRMINKVRKIFLLQIFRS